MQSRMWTLFAIFCTFLCVSNRCTHGSASGDRKLYGEYCDIGDPVIGWYPNNKYYGAIVEFVDFEKKRVRVKWKDNDPNHRWIVWGSVRKMSRKSSVEKSSRGLDAYPICLFKKKGTEKKDDSQNQSVQKIDRNALAKILNAAPLKSAIAAEMTIADVRDYRQQLKTKVQSYVSEQTSTSCSSLNGPLCYPTNGRFPLSVEERGTGTASSGEKTVMESSTAKTIQDILLNTFGETLKSVKLATHAPTAGRFQMVKKDDDGSGTLRLKSDGWVKGHQPRNFVPVGLVLRRQEEKERITGEDEKRRKKKDPREEGGASSQSLQERSRRTIVAIIIDESVEPWGAPMQECSRATLSMISRESSREEKSEDGGDSAWFVGLWRGSYECHGLPTNVNLKIYDDGKRAFFDFKTAPSKATTLATIEGGGDIVEWDGAASAVIRDLLSQLSQERSATVDGDGEARVMGTEVPHDLHDEEGGR